MADHHGRNLAGIIVRTTPNQHKGAGHCGHAERGGDCRTDTSGSWKLNSREAGTWYDALETCSLKCGGCRGCSFISFSLLFKDCSWYSKCNMRALSNEPTGFRSLALIRNRDGESPGSKKIPNSAPNALRVVPRNARPSRPMPSIHPEPEVRPRSCFPRAGRVIHIPKSAGSTLTHVSSGLEVYNHSQLPAMNVRANWWHLPPDVFERKIGRSPWTRPPSWGLGRALGSPPPSPPSPPSSAPQGAQHEAIRPRVCVLREPMDRAGSENAWRCTLADGFRTHGCSHTVKEMSAGANATALPAMERAALKVILADNRHKLDWGQVDHAIPQTWYIYDEQGGVQCDRVLLFPLLGQCMRQNEAGGNLTKPVVKSQNRGKTFDHYPRTNVATSPILAQIHAFDTEVYARATAEVAAQTQADGSMFWRPQQLSPEELARLRLQDAKAWVKLLQDEVNKQIMQRGGAPVVSRKEREERAAAEKEAEELVAQEEDEAGLPETQEGLRSPQSAGNPRQAAKNNVPGCLLFECVSLEALRTAARATQWPQKI